jgi:hypothetical protein
MGKFSSPPTKKMFENMKFQWFVQLTSFVLIEKVFPKLLVALCEGDPVQNIGQCQVSLIVTVTVWLCDCRRCLFWHLFVWIVRISFVHCFELNFCLWMLGSGETICWIVMFCVSIRWSEDGPSSNSKWLFLLSTCIDSYESETSNSSSKCQSISLDFSHTYTHTLSLFHSLHFSSLILFVFCSFDESVYSFSVREKLKRIPKKAKNERVPKVEKDITHKWN